MVLATKVLLTWFNYWSERQSSWLHVDERRVKELTLPLYDSIFSMADEVMNDELLVSKAVSR